MSKVTRMQSANMTWDFIKLMRDTTKMKIILKGIVTEEDADLCLKYGVERVLEILRTEFRGVMQQMGTPNIAAIAPEMVRKI